MVSIQKHCSNINTGQLLNGLMFAQNILQQTGIMGSVWQWQDVLNPQSYMYTSGFNTSAFGTSAFGTSTFGTSTFDSSETSSASTKNKSVTKSKSKSQTKSETKSDTKSETVSESNSETVSEIESDEKTDDEIKNEIVKLVKDGVIKLNLGDEEDKKCLAKLIRKYDAIKKAYPDITDEKLAERLENYRKGYLYHLKETQFGLQGYTESVGEDYGYSNEVIADETVAKAIKMDNETQNKEEKEEAMKIYKSAYHKQAQEYIEYYDDNNNGKVDVNEFIRKEVATLQEMLGGEELDTAEGNEIQKEAEIKIATFDMNNDKELDENEISAYLWARSNWQIKDSILTYSEYNDYENAIYGVANLTEEQGKKAEACDNVLKEHELDIYELPDDLSTLKLSSAELQEVKDGLKYLKIIYNRRDAKEAFENGYEALYTKLDKE